jgi:hypothetical protein
VAGQFLHRTSRALDPHLHTHVVIANMAEGVDGVWSSVDSRRLHSHLGAAQALYHARLRGELGDRMGAAWTVRPSGVGDIVGVDPGLCRLFSTRTASMDEYRQRRMPHGVGPRASAAAFHADRPDKDRSVTVDELMAEWRRRASDLGVDLGDLSRSVGGHRQQDDLVVDRDRFRERLEGLARDSRAIGRRDLVAAVAVSTEGGATVRQVEAVVTGIMEACRPRSLALGADDSTPTHAQPRLDPAQVVRVVDGLDHASHQDARAFPLGPSVPASVSALRPAPEQVTAAIEARRVQGTVERRVEERTARRLRRDDPLAISRSLGIER